MADKPGDPQKGKVDEAAVEADAAAAKEETAVEAVAEEAAASEEAPAEKPKRKPRAKRAQATAAAETGEQKAAAEAATKEGSSEPEAKPKAKAKKPADRKPKAKKAAAEEDAPAKEDVPVKEEPKPAPARKRETGERRVVRAQAKYVRTSARKARLVCDHIRGKDVLEARAILAHTPRSVAEAWTKLLESAVANAEHNHELVGDDLYIRSVTADEGPTLKRFRPRAMGRATKIRKRTSHLTIELTSKE